jgi:hypothetical protein
VIELSLPAHSPYYENLQFAAHPLGAKRSMSVD